MWNARMKNLKEHIIFASLGFSNAEQYSLSKIKRASTKTENKIVTSSVAKKNCYCYVRNYILQKKGLKINL